MIDDHRRVSSVAATGRTSGCRQWPPASKKVIPPQQLLPQSHHAGGTLPLQLIVNAFSHLRNTRPLWNATGHAVPFSYWRISEPRGRFKPPNAECTEGKTRVPSEASRSTLDEPDATQVADELLWFPRPSSVPRPRRRPAQNRSFRPSPRAPTSTVVSIPYREDQKHPTPPRRKAAVPKTC